MLPKMDDLSVWKAGGRFMDPRWLQVLALMLYGVVAREFYGFERSHLMMFGLVVLALVTDVVLSYFLIGKLKNPVSSVVVAFAVGLLIDTSANWIYPLCVVVGVASKFIFRDRNVHYINPGNFGVVFGLVMFPGLVAASAGMFGDSLVTLYLFVILGSIVAFNARQLMVSYGSLALFLLFAWFRSVYLGQKFGEVSAPIFSPVTSLFCFHMITDLATLPKDRYRKILFLVALAALDAWFRSQRVVLSQVLAVFFLSNIRFVSVLVKEFWTEAKVSGRLQKIRILLFAPLVLGATGYSTRIDRLNWGMPSAHQISYLDSPATVKYTERKDFVFEDVSEVISPENLLNHVPKIDPQIQPWVRHTFLAPGIAVIDLNGDEYKDFIVIDSVRNGKVYLGMNEGGRVFKNVAKEWGIETGPGRSLPQSITPIDYNKDGLTDIVVSGFGCLSLYKNTGKNFVDVSDETELSKICLNTIMAVPWDFNRDGETDLYISNIFRPELNIENAGEYLFDFGPNSWSDASNAGRNEILTFKNGKFSIDRQLLDSPKSQFSWDAGVADINGDQKAEILVAVDWAKDQYLELQNGRYVDRSDDWISPEWRSGMSISPLFFDAGNPYWMITNIVIYPLRVKGNFVNRFEPSSQRINDSAFSKGLQDCGWAWGALGADLDLDGDQDVYVANGFITKIPEEKAQMLKAQLPKNEFSSAVYTTIPPRIINSMSGLPAFKSSDPNKNFAGLERDCVFENRDGAFTNIALEAGIKKFWDGRAAVSTDFNNDGLLDIIVTVQEGELKFLLNKSQSKGHFVYLRLEDELKSPLYGTKVIAEQNGSTQRRDYYGGKSGFLAFSDTRMHFGFKESSIVNLNITWPDGKSENLTVSTDKFCTVERPQDKSSSKLTCVGLAQ
jgi:hypothetical protein